MTDIPERCVFKFEGGKAYPCWGEELFYDETVDDKIVTCEGHAEWSLAESIDYNRARYRPEPNQNPEPCTTEAIEQGCTCYIPVARSTDIDPPEAVLDEWCPVHGRDPDYEYDRRRDDCVEWPWLRE